MFVILKVICAGVGWIWLARLCADQAEALIAYHSLGVDSSGDDDKLPDEPLL